MGLLKSKMSFFYGLSVVCYRAFFLPFSVCFFLFRLILSRPSKVFFFCFIQKKTSWIGLFGAGAVFASAV
jgi:hypothetical protein